MSVALSVPPFLHDAISKLIDERDALARERDALRARLADAEREREALSEQLLLAKLEAVNETERNAAMHSVVRAARAWKANQRGWLQPLDEALCEAVDALDAGGAG